MYNFSLKTLLGEVAMTRENVPPSALRTGKTLFTRPITLIFTIKSIFQRWTVLCLCSAQDYFVHLHPPALLPSVNIISILSAELWMWQNGSVLWMQRQCVCVFPPYSVLVLIHVVHSWMLVLVWLGLISSHSASYEANYTPCCSCNYFMFLPHVETWEEICFSDLFWRWCHAAHRDVGLLSRIQPGQA